MAQYCTIDELFRFGIRREAVGNIVSGDLSSAIDQASDLIDGYLGSRYTLPLKHWESDIRAKCAHIAVYDIIVNRGFNSSRAGDENLRLRYEDAIKWLTKVADGNLAPRVIDSASGSTEGSVSGGVKVYSNPSRGYTTVDGYGRVPFTGRGR
jgi:phage gp36-like protein